MVLFHYGCFHVELLRLFSIREFWRISRNLTFFYFKVEKGVGSWKNLLFFNYVSVHVC